MKVVLISLLARGGMIHYTSQLANALSEDHDVIVILPHHADIKYFNTKINFLFLTAPPSVIKTAIYSCNIISLFQIKNKISKLNPDVIHVINSHPWNFFILQRFKKIPKIFTVHDPTTHEESLKKQIFQPISSFTDLLTINLSDVIIVHGKILKDACIKKGIPDNKIQIVPHGDYSFFTKYSDNQLNNHNLIFNNILFFGRIEPYKGVEFFINAACKVHEKFSQVTFTIAGEGDFKTYQHLIENKSYFRLLNRYIPDNEVAQLFQNSDITVLPYISATQSGVVPIAYAFKKPVIVTDVGALSEVVDNGITGFVVPPKDVDSLSEKMIILIENDALRQNMGENAFLKMKCELSWEKIADDMTNIYSNLMRFY